MRASAGVRKAHRQPTGPASSRRLVPPDRAAVRMLKGFANATVIAPRDRTPEAMGDLARELAASSS